MSIRLLVSLVIVMSAAWAGFAVASEESLVLPREVMIVADTGKHFGTITVEAKTNNTPEKLKITGIRVKLGGKWIAVPEAAFSDLEAPLLNRLEARMEPGYDGAPWLYIYFEVASVNLSGEYSPKRVRIAYHNGKFESRSIETPLSGGSTRWDKVDL